MTHLVRDIGLIVLLVITALTLQSALPGSGLSLLPAALVVATVITWLMPQPLRYLLPLAIITELVSSAPPGILTVTMLLPLVPLRLRWRVEAEASFSFLLLLAATAAAQLAVISVAEGINQLSLTASTLVPWPHILWSWLTLTIVTGGVIIFGQNLRGRGRTSTPTDIRTTITKRHR